MHEIPRGNWEAEGNRKKDGVAVLLSPKRRTTVGLILTLFRAIFYGFGLFLVGSLVCMATKFRFRSNMAVGFSVFKSSTLYHPGW